MSQSINLPLCLKADVDAIADVDIVNPPANMVSKPLPAEGCVQARATVKGLEIVLVGVELVSILEGKKLIIGPTDIHLEAPQEWEPEILDFDFDYTASPGADEWQIGGNAEGRAVYSTVGATSVGVTVEFQKWDW
ncbi:hypothetical protein FRC00_010110 [Tulasnella sp. 408]|nr:hypothetical protein FRC00_010110 [Tulasnella sp. 408]